MLVVMGRHWLDARDETGARRLDNSNDFVRLEIATALGRNIPVIPVRVDGARLPKADQLPDDLKLLVLRQAAIVTHDNFPRDMDGLERSLRLLLRPRRLWLWSGAFAFLVAMVVVTYQVRWGTLPSIPGDGERRPSPTPARDSVPWYERAQEREAWHRAKSADTISAYEKYLREFPNGGDVETAKERIVALVVERERKGSQPTTSCRTGADAVVRGVHKCLTAGEVFTDCDMCPQMVVVPAGEFLFGSPASEVGSKDFERPQRTVKIEKAFAVGKFEVTVGEFRSFSKSAAQTIKQGCWVWTMNGHRWDPERSFRNPGMAQGERHPAICVHWSDANAFADWLSKTTGHAYRLLSESEWEYAARAGTTTQYFFGDDLKLLCQYANGADQAAGFVWGNPTCSDGVGAQTAEVGRYRPNQFGLHDVLGNVAEWVGDCWLTSHSAVPSDGRPWSGLGCENRVTKGGAWDNGPKDLRSATRGGNAPEGRDTVGFRVARPLTP